MSLSTYEEIELLNDALPNDGEAVVVLRTDGELQVEPIDQKQYAALMGAPTRWVDPVDDREFYGFLVGQNEALRNLLWRPAQIGVVAWFWSAIFMHRATGQALSGWYWDAGLALLSVVCVASWVSFRRQRLFLGKLWPDLKSRMPRCGANRDRLIGSLARYPELESLYRAMTTWSTNR